MTPLRISVALLAGAVLVAGATAQARPLAHMVFFTLKEDSAAKRTELLDACDKYLTGHDGVLYYSVGEIAEGLDREVNDRRFHVALHMVFDSKESHDTYQTHPRHLELVEALGPLVSEVRVFDSYLRLGADE